MKIDVTLPIKKKWFDMILSGEKKEEYREIKPYWTTRIYRAFSKKYPKNTPSYDFFSEDPFMTVKFINGYGGDKPYFIACCRIEKRKGGNPNWGAEPSSLYYIFRIIEIIDQGNLK